MRFTRRNPPQFLVLNVQPKIWGTVSCRAKCPGGWNTVRFVSQLHQKAGYNMEPKRRYCCSPQPRASYWRSKWIMGFFEGTINDHRCLKHEKRFLELCFSFLAVFKRSAWRTSSRLSMCNFSPSVSEYRCGSGALSARMWACVVAMPLPGCLNTSRRVWFFAAPCDALSPWLQVQHWFWGNGLWVGWLNELLVGPQLVKSRSRYNPAGASE